MSLLSIHIVLEMSVLRKDHFPVKRFRLLYNSRNDCLRILTAKTSIHKILLHVHNDQNFFCHNSLSFLRIRIYLIPRIPQITRHVKPFSPDDPLIKKCFPGILPKSIFFLPIYYYGDFSRFTDSPGCHHKPTILRVITACGQHQDLLPVFRDDPRFIVRIFLKPCDQLPVFLL